MRHPFDLNMDELAATSDRQCIPLSDSESAAVIGGSSRIHDPFYDPYGQYPNDATTLAIGEEGGDFYFGDYYGGKPIWDDYM